MPAEASPGGLTRGDRRREGRERRERRERENGRKMQQRSPSAPNAGPRREEGGRQQALSMRNHHGTQSVPPAARPSPAPALASLTAARGAPAIAGSALGISGKRTTCWRLGGGAGGEIGRDKASGRAFEIRVRVRGKLSGHPLHQHTTSPTREQEAHLRFSAWRRESEGAGAESVG
jgi:hypothetical protein